MFKMFKKFKEINMQKKGLGRIPKSLSWIDSGNTIVPAEQEIEVVLKPKKEVELEVPQELKSTQKGLPAGWIRSTFIVTEDFNEKIKAVAYWDRMTVKEVIHEALSAYLQAKNVKPVPKKKLIL
jgi:hypothetical protein